MCIYIHNLCMCMCFRWLDVEILVKMSVNVGGSLIRLYNDICMRPLILQLPQLSKHIRGCLESRCFGCGPLFTLPVGASILAVVVTRPLSHYYLPTCDHPFISQHVHLIHSDMLSTALLGHWYGHTFPHNVHTFLHVV